jgi:hypothetical protein
VILITAIAYVVHQIRSNWPAIRLYYLQHECLAHPIPPGTQLYSSAQPAAAYKSPEYDALFAQLRLKSGMRVRQAKVVPVYVGTRRAADGTTRFLAIGAEALAGPRPSDYQNIYSYNEPRYEESIYIINRAARFAPSENYVQVPPIISMSFGPGSFITDGSPDVLIRSAIEDPNDPSHVTVVFDLEAGHYVLEFHVQPGGGIQMTGETRRREIADDSRSRPYPITYGKFQPFTFGPRQ